MLTVIETSLFLRYAGQVWDEDERESFIQWIAGEPDAGNVIPGTQIVLLLVYAKAKFDNLSPDYLKRLKEACDGSRN